MTQVKATAILNFDVYRFIFTAIDTDGLLCQTREHNSWHGTRSTKAVIGRGELNGYFTTVCDVCHVNNM